MLTGIFVRCQLAPREHGLRLAGRCEVALTMRARHRISDPPLPDIRDGFKPGRTSASERLDNHEGDLGSCCGSLPGHHELCGFRVLVPVGFALTNLRGQRCAKRVAHRLNRGSHVVGLDRLAMPDLQDQRRPDAVQLFLHNPVVQRVPLARGQVDGKANSTGRSDLLHHPLSPQQPCKGCLGVQVGTVFDYEQQKRDTVIGVYLEGFSDRGGNVEPSRGTPSYGARTTAMFPFDSRVDWSLQPEVNVPLGDSDLFATFAAGPAVRPWSLHTTGCVRRISALQYGTCAHWLSEGKVSLDLNLGVFAMFFLVAKDLGSWH